MMSFGSLLALGRAVGSGPDTSPTPGYSETTLLAVEAAALQAGVDALGGGRPQRLLGLNERLDLPTRQLESLVAKRRQHPTRVRQELLPEIFVGEHAPDKW